MRPSIVTVAVIGYNFDFYRVYGDFGLLGHHHQLFAHKATVNWFPIYRFTHFHYLKITAYIYSLTLKFLGPWPDWPCPGAAAHSHHCLHLSQHIQISLFLWLTFRTCTPLPFRVESVRYHLLPAVRLAWGIWTVNTSTQRAKGHGQQVKSRYASRRSTLRFCRVKAG